MEHKKRVAVIGAGLAGCSVAYELSKFDELDITIFDKNNSVAKDASGNYAGILAPNLTADNNYSDQFHTLGYQLLVDFINQYKSKINICSKGVIQLLTDEKEILRYQKIFTKRDIANDLARLLDNKETTNLLQQKTNYQSLYYPNAVSLEPRSLCRLWLELSQAELKLNTSVVDICKLDDEDYSWRLDFGDSTQDFDVVVFAGGYKLFENISYLKDIPVFESHGQLTVINSTYDISHTIIDKGYIIPNYKNNFQVIGATFRDNSDMSGDIRKADDEFNIAQISAMLDKRHDVSVVESRVAGRCVTSDHLPIIGKLVDYTKFKENFYKPLSKGYPKAKMPKVEYEQGLYLASGFGSKGLCSSLLAAKIISSQINNQLSPASQKLIQALSPQRFWVRSFKKSAKH
ncbi:FAD-dependent 5-carboxymethylaminomethyl-2-thiouridine(34) oxidoreductase MnmC [Francisella sp. Scap27]|uniref:FAD-dependent 5-carboxymethylaminomethyl-2-thiouridine(34) oxidoreductase MnmC n=1 Tax=Francisella sp. Scap27 TaxID=2589986 RepID=UPI0015B80C24|nr:FAD-dependent 5-carboxymethylaminomethyl-2-thiouridine(34) oxidoreductase MnmC [Francisella sp. Scap27]QLE78591.1 FAD-dependent 5-carboxymethylaminomethyl-2-thiouridine(34) oxidoreductase MnmC [Francisella sp. Scap27]